MPTNEQNIAILIRTVWLNRTNILKNKGMGLRGTFDNIGIIAESTSNFVLTVRRKNTEVGTTVEKSYTLTSGKRFYPKILPLRFNGYEFQIEISGTIALPGTFRLEFIGVDIKPLLVGNRG